MTDHRINIGRDFNYFKKITVTNSTFGTSADGYSPDIIIPFSTQSVMFLNEGTTSSQVIEYSFNGFTVHGELDPSLPSRGLVFDNRTICLVWFRIKSGSSSSTIRIDAWVNR